LLSKFCDLRMPRAPAKNKSTSQDPAGRNEICLLGQPSLRRHLDFVKHQVVGGGELSPKAVADAWRSANDHYHQLEIDEAGVADRVQYRALTAAQEKATLKIRGDARFRRTFDTMPTEFAMVELDKLVVFQTRVDEEHIASLAASLEAKEKGKGKGKRGFAQLLDFCFPLTVSEAKVDMQRVGPRRYVFSSASTDFRFQNPMLLTTSQFCDIESAGPIVGIAGVPVGFGSNLFSVIRSGTRMLLHNGYHRACAMRAAGITHAPCIVQTVTRQDEFEVVAKAEVAEKTEFYFRTARPPLLKDFFDPKIRKVYNVRRSRRVIEVNFEIREFTLPALSA
jgi:hypothetical protein